MLNTKLSLPMGPATREAYGDALLELGKANRDIVAIDADLAKSTFSQHGGLGSAVALSLAARVPAPVEYVNLGDRYAESGKPDDLMRKYGMTADAIVGPAERVLARK